MGTIDRSDLEKLLERVFSEESRCLFDRPDLGPLTEKPVLRIASAGDGFFTKFKSIIGPHYWTPPETMAEAGSGGRAVTVLSWLLPTVETVRKENRREHVYPAKAWAYHRTYGEMLNIRLRERVPEELGKLGIIATAPHLLAGNEVKHYERVGWSSRWSERHTAFVAGHGTFGLSGGLITKQGIAHRLGSVVTDMKLEPDDRPYGNDPFAWCAGLNGGTCRACLHRCPVGSIGNCIEERDKDTCYEYLQGNVRAHALENCWWEGTYGCGLCQTGVPCEFTRPI